MKEKSKFNEYSIRWFKALFSWKGILSVLIISAVLGYFTWSFDLIPDNIPWAGYFDDVMIIAVAFWGLYKLSGHFMDRIKKVKTKNNYGMRMLKAITNVKGIAAIVITSVAMSYFLGSFDLIPDVTPVVGYLDDVVVIVAALSASLAIMGIFKKKK